MHYIFVINGRKDKGWILEEVQRQIYAFSHRGISLYHKLRYCLPF